MWREHVLQSAANKTSWFSIHHLQVSYTCAEQSSSQSPLQANPTTLPSHWQCHLVAPPAQDHGGILWASFML